METVFYKSLDRQIELFGIKGRWIVIFLIIAVISVVLGVILGSIFGTGVGIASIAIMIAVGFFGSLTLQNSVPSRRVGRAMIQSKVPGWTLRREALSRILLEDERYLKAKALAAEKKS